MMGRIFQSAHDVLACIGEGDENASYLQRVDVQMNSDQVERFCRHDPKVTWQGFPLLSDSLKDWLLLQGQAFVGKIMLSSIALFSRPFWTRVWIIQELFAGHLKSLRIHCGDIVFDWNFLIELEEILMYATGHGSSLTYSLFPDLKISQNLDTDAGTVMGLLRDAPLNMDDEEDCMMLAEIWTDRFKCVDSRDKVFGLLGLFDQSKSRGQPITPDYSRNALDIGLEVIGKLKSMHDIRPLVVSLELHQLDISELEMLLSQRTRLSSCHTVYEQVNQLHLIAQDSKGRLISAIPHGSVGDWDGRTRLFRDSQSLIFTENEISGVVGAHAEAGDLIIQGHHANFVIRPQGNGNFVFVGAVAFAQEYGTREINRPSCQAIPTVLRWCSCGPAQRCQPLNSLYLHFNSKEALVYSLLGLRGPLLRQELTGRLMTAHRLNVEREDPDRPGEWVLESSS